MCSRIQVPVVPLGLAGIEVTSAALMHCPGEASVLTMEATAPILHRDCPECGAKMHGDGQAPVLEVADLPQGRTWVRIQLKRRKLRCPQCRHKEVVTPPSINVARGITCRLHRHVIIEALRDPFLHVARRTGLSERQVRSLLEPKSPFSTSGFPSKRRACWGSTRSIGATKR